MSSALRSSEPTGPLRLADLVGQARAATVLRNALRRGRVAHAYLFRGPSNVGKSIAAGLFTQALNCLDDEARAAGEACGVCRSCQLILEGSHPDVRVLTTSGNRETTVIPIKEMRDSLVYDIHLKPVLGRHKVYVLDPADRTAPQAIHTILKSLEEPPPYVVIILVTARPSTLPPTVPSRCQQVTFQLAGTAAIETHLVQLGLESAAAASLAALSGGRIGWAITASQRPEVLSVRRELLDLCLRLDGLSLPESLRLAEDIKGLAKELAEARSEAPEAEEEDEEESEGAAAGKPGADRALRAELPWCLDVMALWYRDRLAASQGAALVNPDYEAAIRSSLDSPGALNPTAAIELVLAAKLQLQRNANVDLALESLAAALLSHPADTAGGRRGAGGGA